MKEWTYIGRDGWGRAEKREGRKREAEQEDIS
jgi:hypothetical protein